MSTPDFPFTRESEHEPQWIYEPVDQEPRDSERGLGIGLITAVAFWIALGFALAWRGC